MDCENGDGERSVHAVFEVYADGDGYLSYDLLEIVATLEKGLQNNANRVQHEIEMNGAIINHQLPLVTMISENNYTHIGCRTDFPIFPKSVDCFQGYVIEKFEVK